MSSLLVQDPTLTAALRAVALKRDGHPPVIPNPLLTQLGSCPLYQNGFFPWKALPYPQEHARLGGCFAELGQGGIAEQLARYQRALCDHEGRPIPSLFCQEGKVSMEELEMTTTHFFDQVGMPSMTLPMIDHELGFIRHGDHETTVVVTASGCITGLGTFLFRRAGVLTFAPQLSSVGDCRAYGIAGRPSKWWCDPEKLHCSYSNRLAIPHPRQTGISFLSDAGYSGLWVQVDQQISANTLSTFAKVFGPGEQSELCWTLFGRAQTCVVAGSHRLSSNSLDRYQGPIQVCQMVTEGGSVSIQSDTKGKMEVIPLAGDDSFWGANFLVAYRPTYRSEMQLTLSRSS